MTLQEKRRKILHQIDRYDARRCKKCFNVGAADTEIMNCNCQAAVAIRKLGDRLMKLVTPRLNERQSDISVLMKTLREPNDLTTAIFKELKRLKVTDKVIRQKIGLSENKFNVWKRNNGFRKTYKKSGVKQ